MAIRQNSLMNYDEVALRLVNMFYSEFAERPEAVDAYYSPTGKLIISSESEPESIVTSTWSGALKRGERSIFRCNALKNGENVMAHFSGVLHLGPDEHLQSNEMMVFSGQTNPFVIHYHSVHLSPISNWPVKEIVEPQPIPPPIEVPQKEEKPEKEEPKRTGPSRVDDEKVLFATRTILAENLPFSTDHAEIIPEFEIYGEVSRYAVTKGKILIEFVNPHAVQQAFKDGNFQWRGRMIRIGRMNSSSFR
jgi:hypothetical protein